MQALTGILANSVPSLADALQPVRETNESARSALRSSEVFKWIVPSGEEFSKGKACYLISKTGNFRGVASPKAVEDDNPLFLAPAADRVCITLRIGELLV